MDSHTFAPRRLLIAGCGSIGKRHINNLCTLGEFDMIAFDPEPARRAEVKAMFGIETVDSLSCALKRKPEMCVIAAPTALHVPIAIQAAEQGCHLFIEKPLSHSREQIASLLELVKQNQLVTLVGCNMRFHPGLATVKRLISEGAIGNVLGLRVEAGQYLPDWHPSEDYRESYSARRALGGGVILDMIHEIDYSRWLGGEVAGIFCLSDRVGNLEIDTEDIAAIVLKFVSGSIGEIHVDYLRRGYRRTCQVIGEEGVIDWDYGAGEVRCCSARHNTSRVFANPPQWEVNEMYLDEMKHFLNCLDGVEAATLDAREAAQVLSIALAAKQSAQERRWIELSN